MWVMLKKIDNIVLITVGMWFTKALQIKIFTKHTLYCEEIVLPCPFSVCGQQPCSLSKFGSAHTVDPRVSCVT